MKPASIVAVVIVALIAAGSAMLIDAGERPRRKPYPKPTPPPPASPIFHDVREPAPDAEEIARMASEHEEALLLEVERALVARNPDRREAAFTFLLPELIQVAPQGLAALYERQRGEARELLRVELARQWIAMDRDAAIRWIRSLPDEAECRHSVREAVRALAPVAPQDAIYVAAQFELGTDDDIPEGLHDRGKAPG